MAHPDAVPAEPLDLAVGEVDAVGEPGALVQPAELLDVVDGRQPKCSRQ